MASDPEKTLLRTNELIDPSREEQRKNVENENYDNKILALKNVCMTFDDHFNTPGKTTYDIHSSTVWIKHPKIDRYAADITFGALWDGDTYLQRQGFKKIVLVGDDNYWWEKD